MSTQTVGERGGSSTVQAYVRGQRALGRMQLIIGLIALLGMAFVGWRLWGWQRTLTTQQTELAQQQAQINEQSARIGKFAEGAEPFQSGLIAFGRGEDQYPFALSQLRQAVLLAPEEPAFLRGLAAAQFEARLYGEAVDSGKRLLEMDGVADDQRLNDRVNLVAAYFCAGRGQEAAPLVSDETVRAALQSHQGLLGCAPAGTLAATPVDASAEAAAFHITLIYLHIHQESDRDEARLIAQRLEAGGYRARIQLVETPGYPTRLDVRYYYGPQDTQAAEISQLVQGAARATPAAPQSWASTARVAPLTGYPNLPRDRIEVWLPSGPASTAPPAPAAAPAPVP